MATPMDLLLSNLSRVRIPEPTSRIHPLECCVSFDTPRSEGGLYVDMNTFLAFGKEAVIWNYEKTGNPVYLHINQTKKLFPEEEDRPLKKPVRFPIGVDEYEESYSIVVLPEHVTLPFPSVELPEKVRLAADAILMAHQVTKPKAECKASWVVNLKQVSPYAKNLQQLDNAVGVPPSVWKLAKCDNTDNICGQKTTAHVEGADVYSCVEDAGVMDLQKTEMTTVEMELDQNTDLGLNRIQKNEEEELELMDLQKSERELDRSTNVFWKQIQEIEQQELEPVFGPGYTGLVNVGFSPYFAAVMQVLFSTQPFCSRYYTNQSLKTAFEMASADPTVDLNMQLTKLGHGLLSGKYSTPSKEQEGIPPQMLKTAIETAIHPQFSTMWRHSALLFFKLFMGGVKRANAANPELDPSRSFALHIEDRVLSEYGITSFEKRREYWLSLSIPLDEATNKEEVKAYHKLMEERAVDGKEVCSDEIVRPRVPLEACLAKFSAPQEISVMHVRRKKKYTTETRTSTLASFPDCLVLHLVIFAKSEKGGMIGKKLDVYVDVPEVIDISHLRSSNKSSSDHMDAAMDAATSDEANNEVLTDGGGKYRLSGVVSLEPGTAARGSGHYVAHIYKDGRRVTFDDNRVGVISPNNHRPKDDDLTTGYLYFFQRLE